MEDWYLVNGSIARIPFRVEAKAGAICASNGNPQSLTDNPSLETPAVWHWQQATVRIPKGSIRGSGVSLWARDGDHQNCHPRGRKRARFLRGHLGRKKRQENDVGINDQLGKYGWGAKIRRGEFGKGGASKQSNHRLMGRGCRCRRSANAKSGLLLRQQNFN